jgi:c-di-GMP-binding flagellar brake protein YcgR
MSEIKHEMDTNITNLGIEPGTALALAVDGLPHPLRSIYVGQKGNRRIVMTLPIHISQEETELLRSNQVKIKYLFDGKIFEFTSKLIEITSNPVKLLVLEYPASIDKKEFRSQKRINCFISAKIKVHNEIRDGVIKSISKRGCCCVFEASANADKSLRRNDPITMSFFFPGIIDRQEVLGKIKDIRIGERQLEIGVEFAEMAWCVPPYEGTA